jgi:hypothetical protein
MRLVVQDFAGPPTGKKGMIIIHEMATMGVMGPSRMIFLNDGRWRDERTDDLGRAVVYVWFDVV